MSEPGFGFVNLDNVDSLTFEMDFDWNSALSTLPLNLQEFSAVQVPVLPLDSQQNQMQEEAQLGYSLIIIADQQLSEETASSKPVFDTAPTQHNAQQDERYVWQLDPHEVGISEDEKRRRAKAKLDKDNRDKKRNRLRWLEEQLPLRDKRIQQLEETVRRLSEEKDESVNALRITTLENEDLRRKIFLLNNKLEMKEEGKEAQAVE